MDANDEAQSGSETLRVVVGFDALQELEGIEGEVPVGVLQYCIEVQVPAIPDGIDRDSDEFDDLMCQFEAAFVKVGDWLRGVGHAKPVPRFDFDEPAPWNEIHIYRDT